MFHVYIADGKAAIIVTAIKGVLHKKTVPTQKLYRLRTDGAAAMTGMNTQHSK